MIKQLVFISGLFVAFMMGFPEGGRVSLIHNTDGNLKRGEETIMNVTVSKMGINGFAKYQVTLPSGLVAAPKDIKGAMFAQEGQVLKITWASLPEGDQFVFSYRLLASDEADTGLVKISGRLAYLDNNEKRNAGSDPVSLRVLPGSQAEAKKAEPPANTESQVDMDKMLADEGFACMQTSKRISETEFQITVKMKKNHVNGFVKIETQFCEGLTLSGLETSGGVFSANEGKMKIVWTDFPATAEVTATYKVVRMADAAWMSACSLEGEISYLIEEQSRKCVLNPVTMNFISDEIFNRLEAERMAKVAETTTVATNLQNVQPQETTNTVSETQTVTVSTPVVQTQTETNATQTSDKTAETEQVVQVKTQSENASRQAIDAPPIQAPEISKTVEESQEPSNGSGFAKTESKPVGNPRTGAVLTNGSVQYKVQVCATRRNVDGETVRNAYKMDETPNQEMHDGWYKFTVGGYNEYKDARDKRESLAPFNLPGPFVTAYNSGNRITVQEALMITRQNWVK